MKSNWPYYLGFFIVLFAGYYLFVFSQTDINQSSLPVINNHIDTFTFTDQNGKPFTEKSVEGKIYVADFFFTTCRGICPKMNANMRRVFDAFKNEPEFRIVSHTCMPETDSVPLLKQYESRMLLGNLVKGKANNWLVETDSSLFHTPVTNNSTWYFVTGDKKHLYGMARHSYIIDNNKTDTSVKVEDQFIHTQLLALVVRKARVRGIYDGLKEEEVQKLIKDIRGLLKEHNANRSL